MHGCLPQAAGTDRVPAVSQCSMWTMLQTMLSVESQPGMKGGHRKVGASLHAYSSAPALIQL